MVAVTEDLLARISENPDPEEYDLAGDARALAPAMRDGEIDTPRRVQMFLANVIQETDALKTLEEYWNDPPGKQAYFRSFLGDDWRFHGRGYIMLTWSDNYRAAGRALDVDLVADPSRLVRDKDLAARAAVWYWNSRDCSKYADRGDFAAVCELINRGAADGGPVNGWRARLTYYERAKRFVKAETAPVADNNEDPAPAKSQDSQAGGQGLQAGLKELRWSLQTVRESEQRILARIAELEKERPDEPDRPRPDRPRPDRPRPDRPDKPMGKRWQFTTLVPPRHRPMQPNPASRLYIERHPTRYRWREDIADLIREVYREFGPERIHINTYHEHPGREIAPNAFGRDTTSFDVWDVKGRTEPINPKLGEEITRWLYRKRGEPNIDWIIWNKHWWNTSFPVNQWRRFGEDQFSWHTDHIHVTYL